MTFSSASSALATQQDSPEGLHAASDTSIYVAPANAVPAIIVDIDGTLALRCDTPESRSWYDWHRVGEDTVNEPVVELVRALRLYVGAELVFVSGRSDACRDLTTRWLFKVFGPATATAGARLFMRKHGDNRQDAIVKREIFDERIRDHYDVRYVIDDRDQVVKMWRSLGLTCLQVADGNF